MKAEVTFSNRDEWLDYIFKTREGRKKVLTSETQILRINKILFNNFFKEIY